MNSSESRPTIFVVHHIDTEGPLHEPVREIFKRVEVTLGIKLNMPFTVANLKKLQNGMVGGYDNETRMSIQKITDPHLVGFKSSWYEVDEMLKRMTAPAYRNKFKDSFGGGWIYNWHILDHVGFLTNERRRDMGYLNIFNHYEELIQVDETKDELHWHFHPVPFFREAHIPATSYENSYYELHQVICRRLIEKKWFPRVNRAGFHTIRPDSNFFLEQWIPFDASNQSVQENDENQVDAINGRFGDWKGAPSDWSIYHPDLFDWRKEGSMKRVISRCLNLRTRFRNITKSEIRAAFEKATNEKQNVYLGVTNHDFREMSVEIEDFYKDLKEVAKSYGEVKFKFSGAVEAFRNVLGFGQEEVESESVRLEAEIVNDTLKVRVINGEMFGAQPYLAIKTLEGSYFHDNFDFGQTGVEFFYTFDRYTLSMDSIEKIGIAVNDKYANSNIIIIEPGKDSFNNLYQS